MVSTHMIRASHSKKFSSLAGPAQKTHTHTLYHTHYHKWLSLYCKSSFSHFGAADTHVHLEIMCCWAKGMDNVPPGPVNCWCCRLLESTASTVNSQSTVSLQLQHKHHGQRIYRISRKVPRSLKRWKKRKYARSSWEYSTLYLPHSMSAHWSSQKSLSWAFLDQPPAELDVAQY